MAKPSEKIPRKLEIEPIIEAVWELRFEGDQAAGAALPGILFENLKSPQYNPTIETFALASVPREVRDNNEQLRYAPTAVLRYGNYSIFIGDRSIAVGVVCPYPGWDFYEGEIGRVVKVAKESGLVKDPERVTIRYIDYFDASPGGGMALLNLKLSVGNLESGFDELGVEVKTTEEDFECVIRIRNPATVVIGKQTKRGLVTDVQVGWRTAENSEFWQYFPEKLRHAKKLCHERFFGLLAPETLARHKPVY